MGEGDLLISTINTRLELNCEQEKCGEGKCDGKEEKKYQKSLKKSISSREIKEEGKIKKKQDTSSAEKKTKAAKKMIII
ncbi:MAG: hypothetical protein ACMUEM_02945 [Flavobacteriales bacterium AspAUS03]